MKDGGYIRNSDFRWFFNRFSTALTVPVLIALLDPLSAALANDFGRHATALRRDNPDLVDRSLRLALKDHISSRTVERGNAARANLRESSVLFTKSELPGYNHGLKHRFDSTRNLSVQQSGTSKFVGVNQGFSLDLSSAAENITLGKNLFKEKHSVTIDVGGENKTFSAGSKVTAAEYLALKQTLTGDGQSVTLDDAGRAIGGSVDLSSMTTGNHKMKVDDLSIPASVTAEGNFGKGGDVRIKGDLVNSGSIQVFSDEDKLDARIAADNITNKVGATITSSVSDLTIAADRNFNNFGSIDAAGNLTVSAGSVLTNSGGISAERNLNVVSGTINNGGSLSSQNSAVTLDAVASNMSVTNSGGTIAALNGAINIRNPGYSEFFNTTVSGGDLLSRDLNVHTGGGTSDVFVKQLTGVVNASGTAAHVSADTSVLTIGKQCLVGDPTYFNSGDIVLNGDIVVGENLAVVAGGNITATANLAQITARDAAGKGYNINIIAGANITGSPSGPTPNPLSGQTTTPPNISGNATSSVTIDGPDADGGSVDLSLANPNLTINSNSTNAANPGGYIIIAAFTNAGSGGVVNLPVNSTINTNGTGNANGNLSVIGGTSITLGHISANTGNSGGIVSINSTQPESSDQLPITFDITGSITSNNFLIASENLGTGGVAVQNISAGYGTAGTRALLITTQGAITTGVLTSAAGTITLDNQFNNSTQNVSVSSITSAGEAGIFSFGNITVGAITAGGLRLDNSGAASRTITVNGGIDAGAFQGNLATGALGTIQLNGGSFVAHDIELSTGSLNLAILNTLSAAVDGSGNGGIVTVAASSVTTSGGPLNLQAIGTGTGNGGIASLTFTGANAVTVSGSGDFTFDVHAQGAGNGGSVLGDFAGIATLNAGGIVGNGGANGGHVTVRSSADLIVNAGCINAAGANGDGAEITLVGGQDGSGSLTLNSVGILSQTDATGTDHNGGHLELSGDDVFIPSSHFTLSAKGIGTGNGGSVELLLRTPNLVDISNSGKFSFDVSAPGSGNGGIAIATLNGDVTLGAGAFVGTAGGAGGGAVVSTNGDITVQNGAINVQGTSGSGALISLNAGQDGAGSLILSDTSFLTQAIATGANGDGGSIILTAPTSIQYSSSLATPLLLDARGIGTGNGGTVFYRTNDIASTFIVDPASVMKLPKPPVNFLEVRADSGNGGGNGGAIDVAVGGALTADTAFMTAGPKSLVGNWDGALYSLQSGTGVSKKGAALIVEGTLNADAINSGTAGTIILASRFGTTFSVKSGALPKNGITGSLSAAGNGGTILVSNSLGSINIAQANAMSADSISLITDSKGSITASAGVTIAANNDLTLVNNGTGSVGGKSGLFVNAPILTAQSNNVVNLATGGAQPVRVLDSFAGKSFTLTSSIPLLLQDISVSNGSITVVQNGAGTLEVVDAGLLTATNGGITLQNNDTSGGAIRIGARAIVQTLGKGDAINVAFGPPPKKGTNPFPPGAAPSGVDPQNSGKGVIYFGPAGTVTSEGLATVNAKGVNVVFNSVNNRPIVLGDSSLVLADPPVRTAGSPAVQPTFGIFDRSNDFSGNYNENIGSEDSLLSLSAYRQVLPGIDSSTSMQASNEAYRPAGAVAKIEAADEDDSYAVGCIESTNQVDGAIFSDLTFDKRFSAAVPVFATHNSKTFMESGNALFVTMRDTVVQTRHGLVRVGAGAVVLVSVTNDGLAVYDFDDKHKGSVSVDSRGLIVGLSPGRHVMITPNLELQFAQINAIESIPHRKLSSVVKGGTGAHLSEFSLTSAMDAVKPVQAIMTSKHPLLRKISEHLMKTSSIILQMGGVDYQHYFKPRVFAMH